MDDILERLQREYVRLYEELLSRHNDLRAKTDEIERLRVLLREVHDAAPYLGADINKRVREALGDE